MRRGNGPSGVEASGGPGDARYNLTPMRRSTIAAACLLAVIWMAHARAQAPGAASGVTLYEGARLIAGDGSARSKTRRFSSRTHGSRASGAEARSAPPGAARVDLTGKTVIPALIDGHSHIGYMKNLTSGAANYTRENILDHMCRFAYFGVAASQSMGSDFGELPFQTPRRDPVGQASRRRALSDRRPRAGAACRDQPGQHAAGGIPGDNARRRARRPCRSSRRGK